MIHKNVKKYILYNGYNIEEVAKFLEIEKVEFFNSYMKGKKNFNPIHLHKLANLFAIEVNDLIEYKKPIYVVKYKDKKAFKLITAKDMKAISGFQKIVNNYIKLDNMIKTAEDDVI